MELLFTFEEYWGGEGVFERKTHHGEYLTPLIPNLCELLYDTEVVSEDAFLTWADEKKDASIEDKKFLEQVRCLLLVPLGIYEPQSGALKAFCICADEPNLKLAW